MKRKIICGCFGIAIFFMVIFSINHTNESKYDKKARKAAETCLKNEIEDITWTTVKADKLKYMLTVYNDVLDIYKVKYYAKFDEADVVEDEWIIIEINLSGKTFGVSSYEVGFCDLDYYEANIESGLYKKWIGLEDKDGKWTRVD